VGVLSEAQAVKQLAQALDRCEVVTRFNTDREREAWTLAHSLADLEKSFVEVSANLLPKLWEARGNPSAVDDLLHDIGEELRHILYHIRDPRFFRYLEEEPTNK
jgi:hypothetical protein